MPRWIQNVSLAAARDGHHVDMGPNAMLIQIVDPDMEFPPTKHAFKEVRQFKFLDLEADQDFGHEFKITDLQAKEIVAALQHALDQRMHVLVHCHMGVCRSGAVAEVGVMMGFDDTESFRTPNTMVKTKLMRVLGWTYD